MARSDQEYLIDPVANQQLQELARKVQRIELKQRQQESSAYSPPVVFGKVLTSWSAGDDTIMVRPVATDDYLELDGTDSDIDVYVGYYQTLSGLETVLAADEIVPYHPFAGQDDGDQWGLLAGAFVSAGGIKHFAPNDDGTNLSLHEGIVFYGSESEDDGIELPGAGPFALDTDRKLYVEITSSPEAGTEAAAVTATVQNTTGDWPKELVFGSTGDITINWRLGEILDDDYTDFYDGDVHLPYPLQPTFPTGDYRVLSTNPTAGYLLTGKDGDAISTPAGKNIILRAKRLQTNIQGGTVRDMYEDASSSEIVIGGETDDINQDFWTDIDVSTEDEWTFKSKNVILDLEFGLGQELTLAAEADAHTIKADGVWIRFEKDTGDVQHIGPSSSRVWGDLEHDGTNWTFNGVTGPNLTLGIDEKGHVHDIEIDGTSAAPPEDTTNYKYENCLTPGGGDTIVLDQNHGAVVATGSTCWLFLATTTDAVTESSVDGTFADCSDCLDTTAFRWIDCDTSAIVDNVNPATPGSPVNDFAWYCSGATWHRAKNAGPVSGVEFGWPWLDQCGNAPTSCADLVGWPSSDNFGGSGCNSGAFNDTDWGIRGYAQTKYGTSAEADPSISGGAVLYSMLTGQGMFTEEVNVPDQATGSMQETVGLGTESTDYLINPSISIGGTGYAAGFEHVGGQRKLMVQKGGVTQWSTNTGATSTSIKFVWDGVNVTIYVGGVQRFQEANAGSATNFYPFQLDNRSAPGTTSGSFDDLLILDGSSGNVYIDPETLSC